MIDFAQLWNETIQTHKSKHHLEAVDQAFWAKTAEANVAWTRHTPEALAALRALLYKSDTVLDVGAGFDLARLYRLDELCSSNLTHFAATGITDGPMLRGVRYQAHDVVTYSLGIRGQTGTLRSIESHHHLDKVEGIRNIG